MFKKQNYCKKLEKMLSPITQHLYYINTFNYIQKNITNLSNKDIITILFKMTQSDYHSRITLISDLTQRKKPYTILYVLNFIDKKSQKIRQEKLKELKIAKKNKLKNDEYIKSKLNLNTNSLQIFSLPHDGICCFDENKFNKLLKQIKKIIIDYNNLLVSQNRSRQNKPNLFFIIFQIFHKKHFYPKTYFIKLINETFNFRNKYKAHLDKDFIDGKSKISITFKELDILGEYINKLILKISLIILEKSYADNMKFFLKKEDIDLLNQ